MKTTITDYEINKAYDKRRAALAEKREAERAFKKARDNALEMRQQQYKEEEEIVTRMIQVVRGINQSTGKMVTAKELEHAMGGDMSIYEVVGNMRVAANEMTVPEYEYRLGRIVPVPTGKKYTCASRFANLCKVQDSGALKQKIKKETKTRRFAEIDEHGHAIPDTIRKVTKTTTTIGYVFEDGEG